MRKYLLFLLFVSVLSFKTYAQPCAVGNPTISNITTYSDPVKDSCYAEFDITFGLKANSGNKLMGISLWMASQYAAPAYNKVPNETELAAALGSIVINNDNGSTTTQNRPVYASYPYVQGNTNKNVRILKSDPLVVRTYNASVDSFFFSITNVVIGTKRQAGGSCPIDLLTIKGDLWSSNSGSEGPNTSVQCAAKGALTFSLGNPTIASAQRNCTFPRTLDFRIETISATNITVTYKIYTDDGAINPSTSQVFFNPGSDADVTLAGTAAITDLSSNNPYIGDDISYNGANQTSSDGLSEYWVVVYYTPTSGPTAGETYSVTRLITNDCPESGPLPVTLKYFNAKRNKEKVLLTWETATEINNSGFDIQRKIGNSEWKTIAFMFSKANGGNSTTSLTYEYADVNTSSGLSQYRLRQVDIDTRATLSEIRSVRGESQASRIMIYPNPSVDGKVNLVFDERNVTRNISVSDMSGRIVKQYRNVSSGSLQIDNLQNGLYTLHITDLTTAETTVEKVIIKKR